MRHENEMELIFESRSVNEGFARVAVSAFLTQLNPTVEEVADVKTAVSEAVTNSIVHGYKEMIGIIYITAKLFEDHRLHVIIRDKGCGIDDIELAYAITVHKSQGSEFDCVILPVCDIPPQLKYRNLLYTAVTRAKNKLILLGNQQEIYAMVDNDKKTRRYSALKHMLMNDIDKSI